MSRLDDFSANLQASGLVDPAEIKRVRSGLPLAASPTDDRTIRFARMLIDQNLLTAYQARKVLSGATQGFFLGGYRILRSIGKGGMGKVYLACRGAVSEHNVVAIKVLPPRKSSDEEQAIRRFRREMTVSQRVRHPNVARTVEVGEEGGVYYMVMDYVAGESLHDLVRSERGGSLGVPDAARLFLKLLDGLDAAHKANLIHRDIKPSNIMVTPAGEAVLLDLGLAKALDDEESITKPNVVVGTLDYASPEQLSDAASADVRSDLYSVGCTLYFALTGRPPFEGGDVVNKIYKQRMEDPEPVELHARHVPSQFGAIVRKLMAKERQDRYQDCAELKRDLSRWLDPQTVKAILGASAAARSIRLPPPELDDDDLRWLSAEELKTGNPVGIRDLGASEPSHAPMHKPPTPPRTAVVLPPGVKPTPFSRGGAGDPAAPPDRRLTQFIIIAVASGLLAILGIAAYQSGLFK